MEITIKIDYTNTRLQELRLKAGLSQSRLAAVSGVDKRVIQSYEQGARNLNGAKLLTLLQFCKALNCRLSDIVTDPQCLALLQEIYG